ncbi:hypothetical protein BKA64DRAFT_639499 [Cadophora sp. MPI-SDFR-AT-0126]|nr:hypothetical protein BKA64DRAFT_639499 [Leotiomycetes sp. MPI-SDFR-AT-0126]
MANATPASTFSGVNSSPESSGSSESPNTDRTKIGRPSKWTASRQRKLARLYLFTTLQPKDIREALKEKDPNWMPGKESTNKTVNSLLDKEPRWLRPRTREEMNERILALSEQRSRRIAEHNVHQRQSELTGHQAALKDVIGCSTLDGELVPSPRAIHESGPELGSADDLMFAEFSETPMRDLLSLVPWQVSEYGVNQPIPLPELSPKDDSQSTQDTSILDVYVASLIQDSKTTFNSPLSNPVCCVNEPCTVDKMSLLSIELSTRSLKRRLTKRCSTIYLKTIARLLKAHSVSDTCNSNSSAGTATEPASSTTISYRSTVDNLTIRPDQAPATQTRSRAPRLPLPDAVLLLDRHIRRQGVCLPGLELHDSGNCWCLDELDGQLWVHKDGLISSIISDPPGTLDHLDLGFRDALGNTVLHMLAARGADMYVIMEALERGVDGNSKNVAGQSFLHVLPRATFRWLAKDRDDLIWFLQKLNSFNIRFHDCDDFGRNVFHLLTRQARNIDRNSLEALIFLNVPLLPTYDAFGWLSSLNPRNPPSTSMDDAAPQALTKLHWNRQYRVPYFRLPYDIEPLSLLSESLGDGSFNVAPNLPLPDVPVMEGQTLMYSHARMLETSWLATEIPSIQDSKGRNGLQCLAEVSLSLDFPALERVNEYSKKRKRGHSDPKTSSRRLTFRYELIQAMVCVGVDVNNYDVSGNTVFMAFIIHLPDGEDDKTLMDIFKLLIRSGANIDRRNRKGETALHIAVRLGRKVATRALLNHGANVHARTAAGKGMLALGEAHYLKARDNVPLYASIMACMALCIGCGAVASPTWVQEWLAKAGTRPASELDDGTPRGA